jgi:protein tyrosine/serine phosphatase
MMFRRSPVLQLAVLVVVAHLAWAADATMSARHVRNFGVVSEWLYRGGDPTALGLEELGAMGVKVDIDLREAGEGTEAEEREAKRLGMKYINIPFRPFSAPTDEQMKQVLSLLTHSDSQRVFVHCRRGKDRTGTVIACYRIQHDRWDNRRALEEAKKYGISMAERSMRAYIVHFTPVALPNELAKP